MYVGCDVDCVLYNSTAMLKDYGEKWWSDNRDTPYKFNPYNYGNGSEFETDAATGKYILNHVCNFYDKEYLDSAALKNVGMLGEKVIIVTARPEPAEQVRELFKDTPLQDAIVHTNVYNKGKLCKEFGIEVMLDDRPENLFSCLEYGVHPVLISPSTVKHNIKYRKHFANVLTDWSQLFSILGAVHLAQGKRFNIREVV